MALIQRLQRLERSLPVRHKLLPHASLTLSLIPLQSRSIASLASPSLKSHVVLDAVRLQSSSPKLILRAWKPASISSRSSSLPSFRSFATGDEQQKKQESSTGTAEGQVEKVIYERKGGLFMVLILLQIGMVAVFCILSWKMDKPKEKKDKLLISGTLITWSTMLLIFALAYRRNQLLRIALIDNERQLRLQAIRGFGFTSRSVDVPVRTVKLENTGESMWWWRLIVEAEQHKATYRVMKDATIPDQPLLLSALSGTYGRKIGMAPFGKKPKLK